MNISRTLNTWRTRRQTVVALNRLSDRELEDIGFARGDIESAARNATYR